MLFHQKIDAVAFRGFEEFGRGIVILDSTARGADGWLAPPSIWYVKVDDLRTNDEERRQMAMAYDPETQIAVSLIGDKNVRSYTVTLDRRERRRAKVNMAHLTLAELGAMTSR